MACEIPQIVIDKTKDVEQERLTALKEKESSERDIYDEHLEDEDEDGLC